jgi:hypothetical protein
VVTDIYCEFNVQVVKVTRPPSSVDGPRRNTIGIGTDPFLRPDCRDPAWGQSVHRGGDHTHDETGDHSSDATPIDFGRIWAGSFQSCATRPGEPLHEAASRQWADAIGSAAAHEGAHNYGLSHAHGLLPDPANRDEDSFFFHLMRRGKSYELKDRTKARHFSDVEYTMLATTVGLAMDTMWNWEFTNPNAATGAKLRMSFLSTKPDLSLASTVTESSTPWINPALSRLSGTSVFKGTRYNRYQIEWSMPKAWSGGPPGRVPQHANFRIGATFSGVSETEPDAIIVTDVTLLGTSDQPLAQHPRWANYRRGRPFEQ